MDLIDVSTATTTYSSSGRPTGVMLQVTHRGLKEFRVLKAQEADVLQRKLDATLAAWESKWQRVSDRQSKQDQQTAGKQEAEDKTRDAKKAREELETILSATLTRNDAIDWVKLEDHRPFTFSDTGRFKVVKFDANGKPIGVLLHKPTVDEARFRVTPQFLDKIFKSRLRLKEAEAKAKYDSARQEWDQAALQLAEAKKAYESALAVFRDAQTATNAKVQVLRAKYMDKEPAAVLQNCELVLNGSIYPDFISKDFALNCNADTRILVCDYQLPDKSRMPRLDRVTYVATRNEHKETYLKDAEVDRSYDGLLYQMALRTLHELFEGDTADAIDCVVFNGWVNSVNRGTGKRVNGCLLSVQASKKEFQSIELANVDPKACFRTLKGVSASKLSGMVPIKPILQMERDDPRFIVGYNVAEGIDASTNLAAMDWEDFEHLIREVFAKEFSTPGAEVRITRASADGGVDAVVFDPDPIRGGKIVIQAKRYTNTVGVSAVRDLYGTLLNEGAGKGILVTTTDYGPEAYDFVKDKPLVLLNGSNLLHMLNKHGYQARIDVQEAKSLLAQAQSAR